MKTLTVQEASESLGDCLRRAVSGEQIAINEGKCTVLLQPLSQPQQVSGVKALSAREALRRLQSQSRLTAGQAEDYLREVRAERLADGTRYGQ
jgi:antitoxin (DNA-binding transcriptional repressor) of toxin-antitoxin stability system